jgi:adenine-specific DNA-methyltransferase
MDFFCGSGTTLAAAQELNRKWIGIDKSIHAINATINKLKNIPKNMFSNSDYSYAEEECIDEFYKENNINESMYSYIGK